MASYLMPGLTGEIASRICMTECKAMCCRGPLILELTEAEIEDFEERAAPILPEKRAEEGGSGSPITTASGARCWTRSLLPAAFMNIGPKGAGSFRKGLLPDAQFPVANPWG